jgi:hypothetical protein
MNSDLRKKLKEMIFIYNAVNNGWKIKKKNDKYVFSKKHNNKKTFYNNSFVNKFISKQVSLEN